jgi:hypothetical protein
MDKTLLRPIVVDIKRRPHGRIHMDERSMGGDAARRVNPRVRPEDDVAATRLGVVERLTDPYLTEHDRWVLRQFAQFLAGVAPGPDPRVTRARPGRLLHRQSGWTRV